MMALPATQVVAPTPPSGVLKPVRTRMDFSRAPGAEGVDGLVVGAAVSTDDADRLGSGAVLLAGVAGCSLGVADGLCDT